MLNNSSRYLKLTNMTCINVSRTWLVDLDKSFNFTKFVLQQVFFMYCVQETKEKGEEWEAELPWHLIASNVWTSMIILTHASECISNYCMTPEVVDIKARFPRPNFFNHLQPPASIIIIWCPLKRPSQIFPRLRLPPNLLQIPTT